MFYLIHICIFVLRLNTEGYHTRMQDVMTSIENKGTYDLTYPELVYGAKHAWRNAARCIGRIQWSKLQVYGLNLNYMLGLNLIVRTGNPKY